MNFRRIMITAESAANLVDEVEAQARAAMLKDKGASERGCAEAPVLFFCAVGVLDIPGGVCKTR